MLGIRKNSEEKSATEPVRMTKDKPVSFLKTPAPAIVTNGWTAKRKEYDLKGLIRYRNGTLLYIGAANDDETLESPEGAVIHHGDSREASTPEKMTIKWHPDIASVAVSSYSALKNGPGSFKEYGVYVDIVKGNEAHRIAAEDANANSSSYTLCFGEFIFGETPNDVTVRKLEEYSRSGSERRIGYVNGTVVMDIGPAGQHKTD